MNTPQQVAMKARLERLTDHRITVEWKVRLKKWGPRTTQDGDWLRSIGAPRYFTMAQYDQILDLCSENGLWLETIGEPPAEAA